VKAFSKKIWRSIT